MSDLPPFLQMFARLFAAAALSLWVHTTANQPKDEKEEERKPVPVQTGNKDKPADPPAKTDDEQACTRAAKKTEKSPA